MTNLERVGSAFKKKHFKLTFPCRKASLPFCFFFFSAPCDKLPLKAEEIFCLSFSTLIQSAVTAQGISVPRWDYIVAKQELNGVDVEYQKEQ